PGSHNLCSAGGVILLYTQTAKNALDNASMLAYIRHRDAHYKRGERSMTTRPIFRVYEIKFDDGFVGRIAMSALREVSFRQEIAEGERTGIMGMKLLLE